MVAGISHEDAIMIVIDSNAERRLKLAWLVALLAELGHEREAVIAIAITRECLHSMVVGIDDEQETSMMVEHQAKRIVELAISIALLLGADRELDSSIAIQQLGLLVTICAFGRGTRHGDDGTRRWHGQRGSKQ